MEIKMGTSKGFPRHGAAPVRTCVGCRKACPVTELVRIVLRDGQPVVDARRTLPGRGASIHPRAECVTAAVRQGGLGRAFRCRVVVAAPAELSRNVAAAFGDPREGNGNPE
jgi:N utilization substance protein A